MSVHCQFKCEIISNEMAVGSFKAEGSGFFMQHAITPWGSVLQDKMGAKHLHGIKKWLGNLVEKNMSQGMLNAKSLPLGKSLSYINCWRVRRYCGQCVCLAHAVLLSWPLLGGHSGHRGPLV